MAWRGDDVISLNTSLTATSLTSISVDGGAPTGSDTLIVTGAIGAGPDTVTWTPSGADSGALTLSTPTVNVTTIEHLIYDGQSQHDSLIVSGTGQFLHTPGSAVDAGSMGLTSGGVTMLGINYENLGQSGDVMASGTGTDMLVVLGTNASDTIDVIFTATDAIDVDLHSPLGTHVDVLSESVESYEIRSLEGDDDINIDGGIDIDVLGTFAVFGGGPGAGSDTLHLTGTGAVDNVVIAPDGTNSDDQDIDGLGATIDVTGIELITYSGDGSDALTVDPGYGDHDVRIDDAATVPFDRVTLGQSAADRVRKPGNVYRQSFGPRERFGYLRHTESDGRRCLRGRPEFPATPW